ncbi:MAG TPA: cardiolipin synthase [Tepidisphaeraceae bacterium]|jgi:cardiolipin synthase|nr:cardiolipin synthase [Tepidisphaeraceae bacterium]
MNWHINHWAIVVAIAWLICIVMIPVVLRRQFTPGASIAWIGIIFLHPYIGVLLYFLVGENRLGRQRDAHHRELVARYRPGRPAVPSTTPATSDKPDDDWEPVALQAAKVGRLPVVGGNAIEFFTDSVKLVDRLIADIDAAKSTVHLLYFILAPDETGRRVANALTAAVARGVTCRLLVDAFASRIILRKGGLADELRGKGVKVAAALPTSLLRRRDLRNHRKLAIIDGSVAFAGSQNMINADYDGKCGGPWHDLTGRFTGPIVAQFSAVFAEDWAFETPEVLDLPPNSNHTTDASPARMQLVPTGPVLASESYRRVLLGAIQAARRRLIITTPYFVPDDPTLVALVMAADRGVDVTLILPRVSDQFYTAFAGRAHYAKLMEAGVKIFLFRPGLVHSKTTTVDETLALFGSANLDVRSFNLNFELSILAYDQDVTDRLRQIQLAYLNDSVQVNLEQWRARPAIKRYTDSAVSLLSPLL